jgi:hypothetical protein
MAEMYDVTASQSLTPIVESCECNQEINQVVMHSRSGDTYMQIIGGPRKTYSVVCYVTRAQVTNIETAWQYGNLIRITMSSGTYYGRIYEFSKNPLFDGNNMVFNGSTYEEYFKIEMRLTYESAPNSSQSS